MTNSSWSSLILAGLKIQAETHDSIEDAKAALQLYQLYLKFSEEGVVQTHLEEMYKEGKSCQWKVPNVDGMILNSLFSSSTLKKK